VTHIEAPNILGRALVIACRAIVMALAWGLSTTESRGADDREVAGAAQTAFRANRSAIRFGTVRYRNIRGRADGPDEGLAGDIDNPVNNTITHWYHGPNGRHDCEYSVQSLVDKGGWRFPTPSWRILTDGNKTLTDDIYLQEDNQTLQHQPQIFGGREKFCLAVLSPFGIGDQFPASHQLDFDLGEALTAANGWRLTSVEAAEIDGDPVVAIRLDGPGLYRTYWVDLARGSIPRRMVEVSTHTPLQTQIENRDLREVTSGAWFPFHQTVLIGRAGQGYTVVDLKVEEVDFDRPPDPSVFQLEFPEPVGMPDRVASAHYPAKQVWDLRKLPRLGEPGVVRTTIAAPGLPLSDAPEMPGVIDDTPVWLRPIGIIGLVLLLIGGGLIVRRLRNRR